MLVGRAGPANDLTPPVQDRGIFKALWSVRTLDEHTLKGYCKLLRVLSHKISLGDPLVVEKHILGLLVREEVLLTIRARIVPPMPEGNHYSPPVESRAFESIMLAYLLLGFPPAEEKTICHNSDATDSHGAGSVDRIHCDPPWNKNTRGNGNQRGVIRKCPE